MRSGVSRKSVLWAAGLGLLLLVLELALPSTTRVWPYPHESAYGTTGPMILMVPLLGLWTLSIWQRCPDAQVRCYLMRCAAMLALLQLVALVKYTAQSDAAVALGWYLYYPTIVYVPLLVLFCALKTTGLERRSWVRRLKVCLLVAGAILCLLVLTNDLHQLTFLFDPLDPLWDVRYSYGPVYGAVYAWLVLVLGAFYTLTAVYARGMRRRLVALVFVMTLLVFAYSISYNFRFDPALNSNFALTFTISCVVNIEGCLQLGLFPAHKKLTRLFESMPFDVRLLTHSGETAFASKAAASVPDSVRERLTHFEMHPGARVTLEAPGEKDRLYKGFGVSGGYVLVSEDISELNERRQRLAVQLLQLRRRNRVLRHAHAVRESLYRQQCEEELLDEVDASLRETVQAIRRILASLPPTSDEPARIERRRKLLLVKLLVSYCKRKGALVLLGTDDTSFDAQHLRLVINESMADARSSELDCAAWVGLDRPLPIQTVNTIYDCMYDVLTAAFVRKDATLMVFVTEKEADLVELRCALETTKSEQSCPYALGDELRRRLEMRDVQFGLEEDEGVLHLNVLIAAPAAEPAAALTGT